MNVAQFKALLIFLLFAVIGFGPISPGCLIGMYVIVSRPAWFSVLIEDIYAGKTVMGSELPAAPPVRLKAFLSVLTLFIIDILPVPVTPVIALTIIFSRPFWFYQIVQRVYA